jgi:hypothetical protein
VQRKNLAGWRWEPGVMDGLIFIRGIRFFINQDIGMLIKEVFIIKGDMANDAQAIGDEGKFIGITEMPVNEKLFDQRIGGSMRGHGSISGFVRIIRVIKAHGFGIRFQLSDDAVSKFGVVFLDPCLNTGRIKDGHICFGRIDGLADRFRKVNEMFKKGMKFKEEVLFKPSDLRSIGNLIKATELP